MAENIFRLSLHSTYDESEKVPDFVTEIQEQAGLGDDITGNLMLLLSEAVTNAIVHGNNLDAKKKVDVDIRILPNKVVASVKDQGQGFTYTKTRDPISEENLLKEGGRGIFLMHELSDSVEYLEKGTRVKFVLKRR